MNIGLEWYRNVKYVDLYRSKMNFVIWEIFLNEK